MSWMTMGARLWPQSTTPTARGWFLSNTSPSFRLSVWLSVKPKILKTITDKHKYKHYFKACTEELEIAKSTRLKNSWVTYFDLLVDGKRKLKNYGGNRELIEYFKRSDCKNKFPIFGTLMEEKMQKGVERRRLFDESSLTLSCDCLPIYSIQIT